MTQKKIDRINELARKARSEGLTPEETEEQKALRAEYVADMRRSLTSQLDRIVIVEPDGSTHPLKKDE